MRELVPRAQRPGGRSLATPATPLPSDGKERQKDSAVIEMTLADYIRLNAESFSDRTAIETLDRDGEIRERVDRKSVV